MAVMSRSCLGEPEIGSRHDNGKWRVLLGWNHNNDTIEGMKEGKIWCWVSEPPEKFQVFDQDFNRSTTAGEVRFCGVANFTMALMFHRYWCPGGSIPRDGVSRHKKRCRRLYHEIIRKHRLSLNLPVDDIVDENENDEIGENSTHLLQEKATAKEFVPFTGTQAGEEAQETSPDDDIDLDDGLPGILEIIPGGHADDAMFISDDEDFKWETDTIEWDAELYPLDIGTREDPIELN